MGRGNPSLVAAVPFCSRWHRLSRQVPIFFSHPPSLSLRETSWGGWPATRWEPVHRSACASCVSDGGGSARLPIALCEGLFSRVGLRRCGRGLCEHMDVQAPAIDVGVLASTDILAPAIRAEGCPVTSPRPARAGCGGAGPTPLLSGARSFPARLAGRWLPAAVAAVYRCSLRLVARLAFAATPAPQPKKRL